MAPSAASAWWIGVKLRTAPATQFHFGLPQRQVAATALNPSPTNANTINKANDIGLIARLSHLF
jgi:hypothetical protein